MFKRGLVTCLVATEVAARGLDIKDLPQVVNYELPNVPEDYVHRIGRTGRAGALGQAISLVSSDETGLLRDIERVLRRAVPFVETPAFKMTETAPQESRERRDGRPQGQSSGRNHSGQRGRNAGKSSQGSGQRAHSHGASSHGGSSNRGGSHASGGHGGGAPGSWGRRPGSRRWLLRSRRRRAQSWLGRARARCRVTQSGLLASRTQAAGALSGPRRRGRGRLKDGPPGS